jgi:hypothetical protein
MSEMSVSIFPGGKTDAFRESGKGWGVESSRRVIPRAELGKLAIS